MARGTQTVYPGERNKGLSSAFQPPEEGQSAQRRKCCDKPGEKDEDNTDYKCYYHQVDPIVFGFSQKNPWKQHHLLYEKEI